MVLGDVQLPEPSLPDEPQDLGRDFFNEKSRRPPRPIVAAGSAAAALGRVASAHDCAVAGYSTATCRWRSGLRHRYSSRRCRRTGGARPGWAQLRRRCSRVPAAVRTTSLLPRHRPWHLAPSRRTPRRRFRLPLSRRAAGRPRSFRPNGRRNRGLPPGTPMPRRCLRRPAQAWPDHPAPTIRSRRSWRVPVSMTYSFRRCSQPR